MSQPGNQYNPTPLDFLAHKIDNLFRDDVRKITNKGSEILDRFNATFGKTSNDYKKAAINIQLNAHCSLIGSIELWRRGLVLQEGILLRNALEASATSVHVFAEKAAYENFLSGRYKSSESISQVKRLFPPLGANMGKLYGELTNRCTHVSNDVYLRWQMAHRDLGNDDIAMLTSMLQPLKFGYYVLDLCSELVCYSFCEGPRYWVRVGPGHFQLNKTPDVVEHLKEFFGDCRIDLYGAEKEG